MYSQQHRGLKNIFTSISVIPIDRMLTMDRSISTDPNKIIKFCACKTRKNRKCILGIQLSCVTYLEGLCFTEFAKGTFRYQEYFKFIISLVMLPKLLRQLKTISMQHQIN